MAAVWNKFVFLSPFSKIHTDKQRKQRNLSIPYAYFITKRKRLLEPSINLHVDKKKRITHHMSSWAKPDCKHGKKRILVLQGPSSGGTWVSAVTYRRMAYLKCVIWKNLMDPRAGDREAKMGVVTCAEAEKAS